jgi:hypothetical protein
MLEKLHGRGLSAAKVLEACIHDLNPREGPYHALELPQILVRTVCHGGTIQHNVPLLHRLRLGTTELIPVDRVGETSIDLLSCNSLHPTGFPVHYLPLRVQEGHRNIEWSKPQNL